MTNIKKFAIILLHNITTEFIYMNFSKSSSQVLSVIAVLSMFVPGITGIAQNAAENPGSPAVSTNLSVATVSSASAEFGTQITACRYTFDWDTYIADRDAGRTNSNPYIDQGCVAMDKAVPASYEGLKYSDFAVGQASTKQAFGDDLVVGIHQNGDFAAQSLNTYNEDGSVKDSKPTFNRADDASSLTSIFTTQQLDTIYSSGGDRTSIPRVFSTGPDAYRELADGSRVYRGGRCEINNGNISVRTQRAGEDFNPSLYGIDASDPATSCARKVNGERLASVEDELLKVYQFVYEFKYPSAEQCTQLVAGIDATTCLNFFRARYGRDLAGNGTSGNRTLSTYTYYGSFDDQYSQWVGWVNPDIAGPRSTADEGFLKAYDGYSVYALD